MFFLVSSCGGSGSPVGDQTVPPDSGSNIIYQKNFNSTVHTSSAKLHKRIRVLSRMCGAAVSMSANMQDSKRAVQGAATKHFAVEKCDLYGHAGSSYDG